MGNIIEIKDMMANELKGIQGVQEIDDFSVLAKSIRKIDSFFKEETAKAVNRNLTARNWLIGLYLFEYEQHGNDRAKYGTRLLKSLAEELHSPSMSAGNLKMYRRVYRYMACGKFPLWKLSFSPMQNNSFSHGNYLRHLLVLLLMMTAGATGAYPHYFS